MNILDILLSDPGQERTITVKTKPGKKAEAPEMPLDPGSANLPPAVLQMIGGGNAANPMGGQMPMGMGGQMPMEAPRQMPDELLQQLLMQQNLQQQAPQGINPYEMPANFNSPMPIR